MTQHYILHDEEQEEVQKVEQYLNRHLFGDFPGIDFLATKFKISESKLKIEFRKIYGMPIYQYYQAKQMQLAKAMLLEKNIQVKEIAYQLGYENHSKFSAAFKKHHGVLPSAI